ncbi:MAG: LCP family protein [Lachnospiraceae bacterium]|nr:LCP family protein [Lachnospiraceae bacterium]MBQ8547293.1 LCP family protein [Lachnospiraceae bacterium]
MSEEKKSIFDEFETDEETGEVIIPRAGVGVARDTAQGGEASEGTVSAEAEYIPVALDSEELPELHFDFDFGEEEFTNPEENSDEELILQSIDEALAAQMAVTLGPVENEANEENAGKRKSVWARVPKWCKVAMISVGSLCILLALLVGTPPGRNLLYGMAAWYIDRNIGKEDVTPAPITGIVENVTPVPTGPVEGEGDGDEVRPTSQPTLPPEIELRKEDYVYNILLMGVEALPQFGGERSDTMILVSINSKDKKIYMTSLMRDMYVPIPGHQDDRLNSAYSWGGAPLLVDTVERLTHVKIDGYVKVGFDSFEWIVDRLGGVEITLTAEEAEYLRKTKYITKEEYRNVVAGTQLMNGNQVLGYCRIRKVPTANGTGSDFGRTERQRLVLTKIFNKYKDSNIFTLLSVFNECLPQVTTNISKEDMQDLMEMVVENRILNLENSRIPASGTFSSVTIGKADMIQVKWDKNREILHKRIFGDTE